ncbi:unnamed protein product [Linum trigynum]|uniref:GH18 domain-containing protein n=1 Tax=Linum trigynum TaxID=586398 RepID=A0AAV2EU05_9ROSI
MVIFPLFFFILLAREFQPCSTAGAWLRISYWAADRSVDSPVSEIDYSLFTHFVSRSAPINSSSYELFILPEEAQFVCNFTATVKLKDPSISTLLSILCDATGSADFSSTAGDPSRRKSLIDSSIDFARTHMSSFDLSLVKADQDLTEKEDSQSKETSLVNTSRFLLSRRENFLEGKYATFFCLTQP